MTSSLSAYYSPLPVFTLLDDVGNPGSGYKIWTYLAGTTTPATTYTSPVGDVDNSNPVVADAAGRLTICLETYKAYKFICTDDTGAIDPLTGLPAVGATLWTKDNIAGDYSSTFRVIDLIDESCTLTSLRDLNAGEVDFVAVLGYHAVNDGGGGMFFWDSASNATADNGSVFYAADDPSGCQNRPHS